MNAISPIEPCLNAPSNWPKIKARVNAWRGNCIDLDARAEEAVSDTLIAFSTVPVRGEGIKMPHLVGQRFAALTKLTAADGIFAKEGKAAAKALAAFSAHEAFRACLCHGVATVTLDQKGHVYILFRMTPFQKGKAEKDMMLFDEARADAAMRSLRQDGQRLEDVLLKLRNQVREMQDLKKN